MDSQAEVPGQYLSNYVDPLPIRLSIKHIEPLAKSFWENLRCRTLAGNYPARRQEADWRSVGLHVYELNGAEDVPGAA